MKWVIAGAAVLILGMAGIVLTHEGGSSSATFSGTQKIATISHGESVEIAPFLQRGTWTVVEFTADW